MAVVYAPAVYIWCSVILLLSEECQSARRRIPRWHLRMAQRQGPNTCAVEEVPALNWKLHTECKYWMHRKICGYKTLIRYECCEGYAQVKEKNGCTTVKPLSNLTEVSRQLGAGIFADYLQQSGLDRQLDHVVTAFAPSDSAFLAMSTIAKQRFEEKLEQHLLQHLVTGRAKLQEADSRLENKLGGFLELSRYSNGITTVNCLPVIRRDQEARNGLVHLLGGVLFPTASSSLPELLLEDGRFREMALMLLRSGPLVSQLRREAGPFTIFAPSDEAFQAMNPVDLRRITEDVNVTMDLLRNHVVPWSTCAPAVVDQHRVQNLNGEPLELTCNASGTYVNERRFTGENIFGANGHISVISGILVPDKARDVLDLMSQRADRLSTFLSLLTETGLASELSEGTFTLFAPSNEAFEDVTLPVAMDDVRNLLEYHFVPDSKVTTDSFWDDDQLETFGGNGTLRLKVYRKNWGVDAAIIIEANVEGYNGVVHVIDQVLRPPRDSVIELLEKDERFSSFVKAMKRAQYLRLTDNSTYTVFAPTNEAFDRYSAELENLSTLTKVIRNHIVDGLVSTRSFQSPKLSYDLTSEQQNTLRVSQRASNYTVNSVRILQANLLATNGIVHCVDDLLLPPL